MPLAGSCDVRIDYKAPEQIPPPQPCPCAVQCPPVAWPFSLDASTAASWEFVVQCLPGGRLWLPALQVHITSFGQGYVTTDKPIFSWVGGGE